MINQSELWLIGLEVASTEVQKSVASGAAEWISEALSDQITKTQPIPKLLSPVLPIYSNELGHHFILETTAEGTVLKPYFIGSPLNPSEESLGEGGFISLMDLQKTLSDNESPYSPSFDLKEMIFSSAYAAMKENQNAQSEEGQGGGSSQYNKNRSNATGLKEFISPFEEQLLSNAISTFAANLSVSGSLRGAMDSMITNNVINLPQLGTMVIQQYLGNQVSKLFAMWEVNDKSTSGEWAAKIFAQQIVTKIQGELMSKLVSQIFPDGKLPQGLIERIEGFFSGMHSSATLGAARLMDPDDKVNTVLAIPKKVLVNGSPAASAFLDVMVPSCKRILEGSTTTFLAKKWFARIDSKTMVPSKITKASGNVFIGGPSPAPAATAAAENALKNGVDPDSAFKQSQEVNDAYNHFLKEGMNPNEANAKAREKANRKSVEGEDATKLNELNYQDIEEGHEYNVNGDIWKVLRIKDSSNPDSKLPTGYRSVLFQRVNDGQVFFSLTGSDLEDWRIGGDMWNNIAQGLGFIPDQYQQALADAQEYYRQYPGMVISGHSLGGGLAAFSGSMLGIPVIGVNSAGLGAGSRLAVASNGMPVRPDQINQYNVDGEILSGRLNKSVTPGQSGSVHILPEQHLSNNPIVNSIDNHGIAAANSAAIQGEIGSYTIPLPLPPIRVPWL